MNLTQDHVQENESLFYLHRGLNGGMDFADFCLFFLCLFALVGVFHQQVSGGPFVCITVSSDEWISRIFVPSFYAFSPLFVLFPTCQRMRVAELRFPNSKVIEFCGRDGRGLVVCCCLRIPKSTTKHGTPGQPDKPPKIKTSKKLYHGFLILELGFFV